MLRLDLHFQLSGRTRPFDLIAPAFLEIDLRFDGAGADADGDAASDYADGSDAQVAHDGQTMSLMTSSDSGTMFRLGATPLAPYASVIADVSGPPPPGASVLVGLVGAGTDRVVARFSVGPDAKNGVVSIEVRRGGTTTQVAKGPADLSGPARYAFSVQENYITALVKRTASWIPVAHARLRGDPAVPATGLDLRDPKVLRTFSYGYGAAGRGARVSLSAIQAGLFGQVGVRDPHVVAEPDGTPYVRDGKLYFTLTNAGLAFFQAAHWAVWRLDLAEPTKLEHVSQMFFARDGVVLGDHAGQIVVDKRRGVFHLAMSGWGDFTGNGVHARYASTTEDVLSGAHVIATRQMPLPTTVSSWDPGMTRIRGRWYVSFVESPFQSPTFDFHPALARGPAGATDPVTSLTLVGADRTRHQTEGPILQEVGGDWYLLASDGDERRYPVYDLSMQLLGYLQAPYGTNIPHPMIVPLTARGRTRYLMITFDGTQYEEPVLGYGTHGDFLVMQALETDAGG